MEKNDGDVIMNFVTEVNCKPSATKLFGAGAMITLGVLATKDIYNKMKPKVINKFHEIKNRIK